MHDDNSRNPSPLAGKASQIPSPPQGENSASKKPSPLVGEGRERGLRLRAKTLRRNATPPEQLLWSRLRAHRLLGLGFRRQVPMGYYVADFVCHQARLVIELDGHSHDGSAAVEHGASRDVYFMQLGYRVLRFSNSDVIHDIESCLARILCSIPPTLTLPLKGGGSKRSIQHSSHLQGEDSDSKNPSPLWGG